MKKEEKDNMSTFQVIVIGLLTAILARLSGEPLKREKELLDRVSEFLD